MNGLWIEAFGIVGGMITAVSFVPQILKLLRERDAQAVSTKMFIATCCSFSLWTTYGVMIGSWTVTISNAVSLVLAATILTLKLRFG